MDADTGRELAKSEYAKGADATHAPIAWRPDGDSWWRGARGCLRVWDSALREETVVPTGESWHHNRSLTWSPDGKRLATCSGAEIIIHDTADWSLVRSIKSKAPKLKWHPDGARIAAATEDGE